MLLMEVLEETVIGWVGSVVNTKGRKERRIRTLIGRNSCGKGWKRRQLEGLGADVGRKERDGDQKGWTSKR